MGFFAKTYLRGRYTRDHILDIEMKIHAVNLEQPVTIASILQYHLQDEQSLLRQSKAYRFADCALIDAKVMQYLPSTVAAACLAMSTYGIIRDPVNGEVACLKRTPTMDMDVDFDLWRALSYHELPKSSWFRIRWAKMRIDP